jgi:hypothetical protein
VPGVEEVLLGGEVVVDRLLGDLGFTRDLRDRGVVEAALGEETTGRLGDQLSSSLLLSLPQSGLFADVLDLFYSVGKFIVERRL